MFLLRRFGPVGIALALVRAATATRAHWREIPEADRLRMRALSGKSRGRPSNLSPDERSELLGLMRTLHPLRLLWRLARAGVLPLRRGKTR